MHRVIADKNGGKQVPLSKEEILKVETEWKNNAAEQALEDKKELENKALATAALNKLTAGLTPEEKVAFKNSLRLS